MLKDSVERKYKQRLPTLLRKAALLVLITSCSFLIKVVRAPPHALRNGGVHHEGVSWAKFVEIFYLAK